MRRRLESPCRLRRHGRLLPAAPDERGRRGKASPPWTPSAAGMLAVSPGQHEELLAVSAPRGPNLSPGGVAYDADHGGDAGASGISVPERRAGRRPARSDVSEESRSRFRVALAAPGPASFFRVAPAASGPARSPALCAGWHRLIHPLFAVDWGSSLCRSPGPASTAFPAFDTLLMKIGAITRVRLTAGGGWNPPHPRVGTWGIPAPLARLASSIKSG